MKNALFYTFTFFVIGLHAQTVNPIDEITLGVNYTLPDGHFFTTNEEEEIISQKIDSKIGYSLGIQNTLRKTKPIQFMYGVELNYLSVSYEVDYHTPSFNLNDANFQKHFLIPDDLQGELHSMLITLPLFCRFNLQNTKSKLPIFMDAGLKYDFITAYRSTYKMDHYAFDSYAYSYSKEVLDDNSRFYNKRYNLNLTFGIGTILKRTALKLSYTYSIFDLETKILKHYGKGQVKMSYLNVSVNYKLSK